MAEATMKAFAILVIIFEIWLAFLYGFVYYYNTDLNNIFGIDVSGMFLALSIGILILIGFGLLSTYIQQFSVSGMVLVFFILLFSIQYYFIVFSFWVKTGLTHDDNVGNFNEQDFITLGLTNYSDRVLSSVIYSSSLHNAMACGLALIVAMFAVLGRTGPLECFILVAVGAFFYAFNQAVFWRISVADAGFCGRIFLFGSSLGIVSSLILGKRQLTALNRNYFSTKSYQALGLVGAIFVFIFIPALTVIHHLSHQTVAPPIAGGVFRATYAQIGPFNIYLALTASTVAAFCVSILVNKKISVHDVVFSSMSGAVAYGALSDLNVNTFPPILVGLTAGAVSALLNSVAKKRINSGGVIDSQGVLFSFLVPGIIGSCYSAIIAAIDTQNPGGANALTVLISGRSWNGQGGIQMAGMGIAIGVGALAGLIVGILYKLANRSFHVENDQFNDETFIKFDKEGIPEVRPNLVAGYPTGVAGNQVLSTNHPGAGNPVLTQPAPVYINNPARIGSEIQFKSSGLH